VTAAASAAAAAVSFGLQDCQHCRCLLQHYCKQSVAALPRLLHLLL
jgi:hypothetical protein